MGCLFTRKSDVPEGKGKMTGKEEIKGKSWSYRIENLLGPILIE